jgi:hypothetical protein
MPIDTSVVLPTNDNNGGATLWFTNLGKDLVTSLPVTIGCIVLVILLNFSYIKLMSSYPEALAKVAVITLNIFGIAGAGACLYGASRAARG